MQLPRAEVVKAKVVALLAVVEKPALEGGVVVAVMGSAARTGASVGRHTLLDGHGVARAADGQVVEAGNIDGLDGAHKEAGEVELCTGIRRGGQSRPRPAVVVILAAVRADKDVGPVRVEGDVEPVGGHAVSANLVWRLLHAVVRLELNGKDLRYASQPR